MFSLIQVIFWIKEKKEKKEKKKKMKCAQMFHTPGPNTTISE
jgi:hypothetical protein